jgi:HEAT repeat protein
MKGSRDAITELLRARRYAEILVTCGAHRKTVRSLRSLLYAEEALLKWRAVSMFGWLAAERPDLIAQEVDRLIWSLNDEAGSIGRGAAECLGEIGRKNIGLVQHGVDVVIHYIEDPETCRPPNRNTEILLGVLWALGRLGGGKPKRVQKVMPVLLSFTEDPEPAVRGHAAWSLGQIGGPEAKERLNRLTQDAGVTLLYENEVLNEKAVAAIAQEALAHLNR